MRLAIMLLLSTVWKGSKDAFSDSQLTLMYVSLLPRTRARLITFVVYMWLCVSVVFILRIFSLRAHFYFHIKFERVFYSPAVCSIFYIELKLRCGLFVLKFISIIFNAMYTHTHTQTCVCMYVLSPLTGNLSF